MVPYLIVFAIAAIAALMSKPSAAGLRQDKAALITFSVLLALMIGFRYRVGADWGWIQFFMERLRYLPLTDALSITDPAYGFLLWTFSDTGLNSWIMALIGGSLFCLGLTQFCFRQPSPWLTMLVAIPYLVTVVGMGYDRQTIAIGFILLALASLQNGTLWKFLLWIICAALFHKTSALLVPLGIFGLRRVTILTIALTLVAAIGLFIFLLQQSEEALIEAYVNTTVSSSGAATRVLMNAVPALLYIVSGKRFALDVGVYRLWLTLSIVALLFVPILFYFPSTTAVDRMALYFIPVQLFVLGRLPLAWGSKSTSNSLVLFGVAFYSGAVMLIWLNFADTAIKWVPYDIYPSAELIGHSI